MEDNITVGESRLKGVMPEIKSCHNTSTIFDTNKYYRADKTLSTPLPPVKDCVLIDVDALTVILVETWGLGDKVKANRIANSKSILKWRSV